MNELVVSSGSKSALITPQTTGKLKLIAVADELGDTTELNLFYKWWLSFRLESVRITANIVSLPVAPFPDIYPEDGAATRNAKILNVEYQNPRFYLRIFKKVENFYYELGQTILQNKGMQTQKSLLTPILTDGNIKFLNKTDEIYAEIIDAGYGLLSSTDFVQFELDYSYEISGIRKQLTNQQPTNFAKFITAGTPQLLRPSNEYRSRLSFTNNGEGEISFAYGSQTNCVIGQCSVLRGGQSWNDELLESSYKQAIWAIAHQSGCLISGIEGTMNG